MENNEIKIRIDELEEKVIDITTGEDIEIIVLPAAIEISE